MKKAGFSNPRIGLAFFALFLPFVSVCPQVPSDFIVVDQFGYLPDARKVAVLRNPVEGFDADGEYVHGTWCSVVNSVTGEEVFRAEPTPWNAGMEDPSSGDRVSHIDFSTVTNPGRYYILDVEQHLRSFEFTIAPNVYNEVLRQAMRTFFYQRAGFAKQPPFADPAWADGASHSGSRQDPGCRSWFGKEDPGTARDVSGGWYDAGDYNKYTSWTAHYVVEFMLAYLERPRAWGDDYRIPESGNGIPDILDEARWGIDHLLRMQLGNGAVLSIVGEDHASPPSAATGPSYYGTPSTSATLNTAAALALASRVFREQALDDYADTLLNHAVSAFEWAEAYPDSLFYNNSNEHGTSGLGAGQQETNDYGRAMARLKAACFLFGETHEGKYREYFDTHYQESHLFLYNSWASMYESSVQDFLLYYTTLAEGTASVKTGILDSYRTALVNGDDHLNAYLGEKDPYLAFAPSYTWGSNGNKSAKGSMFFHLITYGMDQGMETEAREAAESYVHNLLGLNPLNMVYLSNMGAFGAKKSVNEFYHSWFADGSPLWDRKGISVYGPAPGFLTGGPNPGYDWDGCCPSGCGSSYNNALCTGEDIYPPKGQPAQKSYKDFNTSWPLNSWSVTENSCGYQTRFVRLLSKFVTAGMDCNGEVDGTAFLDSCGRCAGGGTGIDPILDSGACGPEPSNSGLLSGGVPGISLYPNPGSGILHLGTDKQIDVETMILDMKGREIMRLQFTGRTVLDAGTLAPGVYVAVHTIANRLIRQKLIIL